MKKVGNTILFPLGGIFYRTYEIILGVKSFFGDAVNVHLVAVAYNFKRTMRLFSGFFEEISKHSLIVPY